MLSRRHALTAAAATALTATLRNTVVVAASPTAPAALPIIPADEDYEFVAWVEIDLSRWKPRATPGPYGGSVTAGTMQSSHVQYALIGGRKGGAWHLQMNEVRVEDMHHGEDLVGPALIAVDGQTTGPEPLALLEAALHGHLPLNQQRCIRELSEREFAFLNALSPDVQDVVIAGLQDMDSATYPAMRSALKAGGDLFAPQATERGLIDADA
jgi:hypothetical protein